MALSEMFAEVRRRRLLPVLALYIVGSWVVLQVAALLFPGWHIRDEAIRFVLAGVVFIFPIALLVSWRYDFSRGGIARTAETGTSLESLRRSDLWILAVLSTYTVVVCVAVTANVIGMRTAPENAFEVAEAPENSIAVLPFVNLSTDNENEYFSDGISEQLLNELAQIPDLRVAARTSAFHFKGKNEDTRVIGRALGVRTVLEGSVRKVGSKVRITAQLINAEDGFQLWSNTYDRELDDILQVQDEIATAIADTLEVRLLKSAVAGTSSLETSNAAAYDRYLYAKSLRKGYDADAIVRSNEMLNEVIAEAPDFARAYTELAYGYVLETYYDTLVPEEAVARAVPLLEKALALDSELEEAYETYGLMYTRLADYANANEHFRKALAINANHYGTLINYGFSLVLQGRLKEASVFYLRAQAVDPLNGNLAFNVGALLMLMGRFDDGRAFMQKSLEIDPDRLNVKAALAHWNRAYGYLREALTIANEVFSEDPDNLRNVVTLVGLYLDTGKVDVARKIIDDAIAEHEGATLLHEARLLVWLVDGDRGALYEFVDREYDLVDANPGDPLTELERQRVQWFAWAALLRGENRQAADYFYWVAGGDSGIASKSYDQMEVLKYLALSYKRLGRIPEADALIEQCLRLAVQAMDNGWLTPQLHYRVAEVHALRGDAAVAAEHLQRAVESGWRDIVDLEHSLFWSELGDDALVEQIKRRIYEDIAQLSGEHSA